MNIFIFIFLRIIYLNFYLKIVNCDNEIRIYGGEDAKPGQFPSQVLVLAVNTNYSRMCGGSMINTRFVLTAAHCFKDMKEDEIIVFGCDVKHTDPSDSLQLKEVNKLCVHPKYEKKEIDGILVDEFNDIAILQLEDGFATSKDCKPIEIAEKDSPINTECDIIGWGDLGKEDEELPKVLQHAKTKIIQPQKCGSLFKEFNTKKQICVGNSESRVCAGDSGGPLLCNNYLEGIVSYGTPCGPDVKVNIDVFTRAKYFKKFVEKFVETGKCSSPDIKFQDISRITKISLIINIILIPYFILL